MKQWDDYSTDEKCLALVNEIANLRKRCDEQAAMIGEQRVWIEQIRDVIDVMLSTFANHRHHFEQMNINNLAINNCLMENHVIDLRQYRANFAKAAHVHDQFTAAIRDGKNPMEKHE